MAVHLKCFDPSSIQAIHQFFEQQATNGPSLPAIEFGGRILTYSSLNDQSNQLAYFLMSTGVGAETLVGVAVHRSFNMIIAILAILKAGGTYVPIDPNYPRHRIEYILADSAIQLLLTQQSLLSVLPTLPIKTIALDDPKLSFSSYPKHNPQPGITPENLAYLLYTSGSTGNPKGVMVSHSNLIETFLSWQKVYELTAHDCHLQMASFSFDVFSGDLIRALCSGAKLVLCPKSYLLKPEKLYGLMLAQRVNCAEFVPTILRRLLDYAKDQGEILSFMRLLICGSDSWSLAEYRALKAFCGAKTRVINSYGLTEATIDSTWFEESSELSTPSPVNQYVPIGKPFPHAKIFLLDEQLNVVPRGSIGEIYIAGTGVASGYYRKPKLTKERFINHRINGGAIVKLYKTGDQGSS